MARNQIRVSRRMLFSWFMLASFIFLLAPRSMTNKFQFAFARIFRGPLNISKSASLSALTQQPSTDAVSRRQYNKLQNYLANVTEELAQERRKVRKLSGIYSRRPLEGANLVFADIITDSINASHSGLIINRGEYDGLKKNQLVLGDNSIIGTISDVLPRTAKVTLITDSASKIPVKIAGSDANRIMQGTGSDTAKILMLSIKHKVRVGDVVYALKKPGFLDVPMIVGKVTRCKKDDGDPLLWDITVKPACDMEKLTDVAVIIMNPQ